jgi:hypothetical protein
MFRAASFMWFLKAASPETTEACVFGALELVEDCVDFALPVEQAAHQTHQSLEVLALLFVQASSLLHPAEPQRKSPPNSRLELAREDVDLDSFVVFVEFVEELDSAAVTRCYLKQLLRFRRRKESSSL